MFNYHNAPAWVSQMATDIAAGEFDEETARDYGLKHGDAPWRISDTEFEDAMLDAGFDFATAHRCVRAFWETAPAIPDSWTMLGCEEEFVKPPAVAETTPFECSIPTQDDLVAA